MKMHQLIGHLLIQVGSITVHPGISHNSVTLAHTLWEMKEALCDYGQPQLPAMRTIQKDTIVV